MNKEKISKEEKKALKLKEREEKKAIKLKNKEEKLKNKEENKKKIDKSVIFRKIMAALLIIFTLVGTCYTFIYLVINS